ncbi:hypothetical protein ZWY2020_057516 [Hordeum vulgare]|nr:hypothetical protein ZWY2020_057516 [Hordeum vulgare]
MAAALPRRPPLPPRRARALFLRHLRCAAKPAAFALASPSPWRLLRTVRWRQAVAEQLAALAAAGPGRRASPLPCDPRDAGRRPFAAPPRAGRRAATVASSRTTPLVVYITNLAVMLGRSSSLSHRPSQGPPLLALARRQEAWGFCLALCAGWTPSRWTCSRCRRIRLRLHRDKLSHIVTNFHVICGASDLRTAGRLDQQGRLELAERRRRRLELPDRRPNLSNNSKEDATRCLVSLGDLIDVEKLGGSAAGSDTLHLRVTGMATAGLLSAMRDYTIRISTS